ncbi:hypothetical protein [Rhizobium phaseoli]|uniref:hypothetical protein n=1 Tax=Rhizobium phaseoli TaxID=396 RepID=UPI0007E9497E|nr:hypothetical protein [Rhizobium phaseoli]ANL55074.1 hypothetical protein AMC86_CH03992 [Rhizobium phaseoli]
MKYSFCAAAFGVASLISAGSTNAEDDFCKAIGKTARSVMVARQRDVDLSAMMETANTQGGAFKAPMRQMIIAAYERPAYSTEEMQAKEISEFANEILLACYKRVK